MTTSTEQLLADIEAFLKKRKMFATDFGKLALGDPNLIADMRKGRSPSMKTADKVRDFMKAKK